MLRTIQSASSRTGQRGFSLVELMIAILIALFLLGGLVTLVMGTRRSSATQSAVSQLQDNQRIALTLMTNVVQKAGYFPDPVNQTPNIAFPATTFTTVSTVSMPVGQALGGTYSATAPGDTFMVRYLTPPNDTTGAVINCAGQSNLTGSSAIWYTNAFQIGTTANGTSWLQCRARTGAGGTILTINLIPNVTNMAVLYGVASATAGDDNSVVQYLNASQMTATNWLNVTTIKVTLTFQVPNYGTTGGQMLASSAPNSTTTIQRVIPIMSRTGVNL